MNSSSVAERKARYRRHCADERSIPLFSRDWWLDATAGEDGWGVVLTEKGGQVTGSMPFEIRRSRGFLQLVQPRLTQTLGPWIRLSNARRARALGTEKDVMEELIMQLPPFDYFAQNWHHSRTNWLPFYWHGFSQTTRYTYILRDLHAEQALWQGLRENIRTDIRKATGRCGLSVRMDGTLDAFLALNHLTFARQGARPPYSDDLVRRIHEATTARGCSRIVLVEDSHGRPHAAAYLVWDDQAAYYLMGGSDPEVRNTGAMSLCVWQAILFAAGIAPTFDFEGSMIEPVERFCRAFGAEQVPYFRVTSVRSPLLSVYGAVRDFLRSRKWALG